MSGGIGMNALSAKNRLHGYIVVHQQLSRLQLGYTPVTRLHRCQSTTYLPSRPIMLVLVVVVVLDPASQPAKRAEASASGLVAPNRPKASETDRTTTNFGIGRLDFRGP